MPRFCRLARCVVAAAASILPFLSTPLPAQRTPAATIEARKLESRSIYERASVYVPDSATFGAYVMAPIGDLLYLGISGAEPGSRDGAMLASFDGDSLRPLASFSEQGLHELVVDSDRLLIPGTDPSGSDDWSAGNLYVYQPGSPPVKHRSQPNVIHTWGLAADGDHLYAAAAAHTGDGWTPEGTVLKSTNGGIDWTRVSAPSNYTLHDIASFNGDLYATMHYADRSWTDYKVRVARSVDGGVTWRQVSDVELFSSARLVSFDGNLLAVDSSRTRLVVIDGTGHGTTIQLPFALQKFYHSLAPSDEGYIYVITDDRRVMRSGDLAVWEEVARLQGNGLAIVYWPARDAVVVSEVGGDVRVIGLGRKGVDRRAVLR